MDPRRCVKQFWWAMALPLMLFVREPEAAAGERQSMSRDAARAMLARVQRWGCQYQHIDLAALAVSDLDLVVIEPVIDGGSGRTASPEEIDRLKHKTGGERRLVLAYLSVGAAEAYRAYWKPEWQAGALPDWLGEESPDWPRSYTVRYWRPEWREIVLEAAIRLAAAGYDGLFLDRVDAFHDWREIRPDGLGDMSDLVAAIAAATRELNPGFLLVGQNAEQMLKLSAYVRTIDAVSKESLLTGLAGQGVPNSAADVAWSLDYLIPAKMGGLTILSIEYLEDHEEIGDVAREHRAYGFVPFFGTRLLDRQP